MAHRGRESMPARVCGRPHTVASQPGSREHRSKPEANKPPRSAPPDSLLPVQSWTPKAAFPTQHPQLGKSVQTQESVGHFKSVKSDGGCHGDQVSNKGERLSRL